MGEYTPPAFLQGKANGGTTGKNLLAYPRAFPYNIRNFYFLWGK